MLRRRPELDAAEVAQEINASVRGTERLLEACVSLGLLKSKYRRQSAFRHRDCPSVGGWLVRGRRRHHLSFFRPLFPASQTTVYKNANLSKHFLLSDTQFSLRGYIQHCDKSVWPLFSHLEEAVLEGSNQHHRAFGTKSDELFQVIIWMKTGWF